MLFPSPLPSTPRYELLRARDQEKYRGCLLFACGRSNVPFTWHFCLVDARGVRVDQTLCARRKESRRREMRESIGDRCSRMLSLPYRRNNLILSPLDRDGVHAEGQHVMCTVDVLLVVGSTLRSDSVP